VHILSGVSFGRANHINDKWHQHKMIDFLSRLGRYDEIEGLYRQMYEANMKTLGENSTQVLRSLELLAEVLLNRGKGSEAEELFRKNLELKKRLFGRGSAQAMDAMISLSGTLRSIGKNDEAREHVKRAIMNRRRQAEKSSATPQDLNSFAWLLLTCEPVSLREPHTALSAAQKAVQMSKNQSPHMLDTLALAYHRVDDNEQAIKIQKSTPTYERQAASSTPRRASKGSHHPGLSRYHCTAPAKPTSNSMRGDQPSSVRSLLESSR